MALPTSQPIDPNGSDFDAINNERTLRWAAEDAKKAAASGRPFAPSMEATDLITGLLNKPAAPPNQEMATASQSPDTTFQQDSDARAKRIAGYGRALGRPQQAFADGGTVETADQVLARMAAKYGVPSSAPAPAATTAPPVAPSTNPAPRATAPAGGSLIQRAAGLLGGRKAQIDKAVDGYQGGGKIQGPGTSTSDSIPATVSDTGEDIRVSTGERILSEKQDALLSRIAKLLGFPDLDAMLEAGTGQPVGPTMKQGEKAAAKGAAPEDLDPQIAADHNALLRGAAGVADVVTAPGRLIADAAGGLANMGARTINAVAGSPIITGRYQSSGLTPFSDMAPSSAPVAKGAPQPATATTTPATPAEVSQAPATPAPAPVATPLVPPGAQTLTTKDIVPGGYTDRGAGIVGSRDKRGQLSVTNVGTGGFADPASPIVDGSASALIDQRNSTYNPARQLEAMQRMRMASDAADSTITDPTARAQAQQGLAILNAGNAGNAQAGLHAAQARLQGAQAGSVEQLSLLHQEYLDPKTTPERREALHGIIRALSGKERDPEYATSVVPGEIGQPATFITTDKRTGNLTAAGTGRDAIEQVSARKAAAAARPSLAEFKKHVVAKNPGIALSDAQITEAYAKQFPGAK